MRTHLYTSLGAIKAGNDLLLQEEGVKVDVIWGHGGLFKTEDVGQKILAAYMLLKDPEETLSDYLENKVFKECESVTAEPDPEDTAGFERFMKRYMAGLAIRRATVETLA